MLARDPVLRAVALSAALAGVPFVLLAGDTVWEVRLFWLFQLPFDALLALASWRVHRLATGAIRRFWAVLAAVGALFLLGDTVQTVQTFTSGRWSTNGGLVQTACFATGLVTIVAAMLVHPHPGRSGRDRLAFWLDSATVLVGGLVVTWCFAVDPDVLTASTSTLSTLGGAAVTLTSAFAAVKTTLKGNAPIHRIAGLTMVGAAAMASVGYFLAPPDANAVSPSVYLIRFGPSALIAAGARIQVVLARFDPAPFGDRRRKPYSLLPYGSIAVAFGALIVILSRGVVDVRLWGVVTGLGISCALVTLRQLVAFHDNAALIKLLDTTLAELRQHETRLRRQALFDGLTGLANRTHFHEEVGLALADQTPASLLLIDLDGFKAVNDTLGHAAGDELLIAVADRLRTSVRAGDLAARLGGDEFAVLLRACPHEEAERTAQRILATFAEPAEIGGIPMTARASIGIADADPDDGVRALLHRADMAMYAAKAEGKGIWRRYRPGMENADPVVSRG